MCSSDLVQQRSLNQIINELRITKVKLLKIEAEGAEPEVLKGSERVLHNIEFIAIDGGPERGENEYQTLSDCVNFLLERNFIMIDIYFPWHRALFKNSKLEL